MFLFQVFFIRNEYKIYVKFNFFEENFNRDSKLDIQFCITEVCCCCFK